MRRAADAPASPWWRALAGSWARAGRWLAVGLAFAAAAPAAEAIPAFARKYRTSCNTCHVIIPKLNDFGEAFRLNGFKIPPDDEIMVKDEPVSLGAPASRSEWPSRFLPVSIPHLPPVAVWIQMGFTEAAGDEKYLNFGAPSLIWLLGANLGEHVSLFMEQGPKQRAYLKIDDVLRNPLFGDDWIPSRLLDLRFGLLEPELIAASDARRIPLTNHLIYTRDYKFPNGNGNPIRFDRQVAAELSGIAWNRFRYVAGVTNGSNDSQDNNGRKDGYFRGALKIWGMAFTGREEVEESLEAKENWVDNSVTVGGFAYKGWNSVPDATEPGRTYLVDFWRFGADLRVNWKNVDVVGVLTWGEDDNAANDRVAIGIMGGLVELDWMVWPWAMVYAKFEWLDFRGPTAYALRPLEVQHYVVGVTGSLYVNFRLTAEYRIPRDLHHTNPDDVFLFRMDVDF